MARGARAAGATVELVKVEAGQTDFDAALATVAGADAVIFGSPTDMGTVSGPFKMFMDASVKPWFGRAWKDKLAVGFTNSGGPSRDKLNTLVTLAVFAAQHSMIWVSLGEMAPPASDTEAQPDAVNRLGGYLGAMTQAVNDSPEVTPKGGDLATARALGSRVAAATARWNRAPA